MITPIINKIDPEKKINMVRSDILTALTAGLALLGLPEVSAKIKGAVSASAALVANVVSSSIQQAPGVAKAVWPAGTDESKSVQTGDLSSALSSLNSELFDRINAGLLEVMDDVPFSLAFRLQRLLSQLKPPFPPLKESKA